MGTRQKFTETMALLTLLLGAGCTPPGARAMLEGREHLDGNRPQQAAAAFEKATRLLPEDWRTWNHLGLALHRGGKHVDAGKAYQRAIKLMGQDRMLGKREGSHVLYFNMGRLYMDAGEPAYARQHLSTYAQLESNPAAHYWLAEACRRDGRLDEAELELGRALAQQPDSARTLNRLGVVQLERKLPMKALDSFRGALQKQPDYSAAQLNLAIVLHRHALPNVSQPRVQALAAYRKYLEMNPKADQAVQRVVADLDRALNPVAVVANAPTNTVAGYEPPLQVNTNDATFIVQAVFPNGGKFGHVVTTNAVPPRRVAPPPVTVTATNVAVAPPVPKPQPVIPDPPQPPKPPKPVQVAKVDPPKLQPPTPPATSKPTVAEVKLPDVPGIERYTYHKPKRPSGGDREKAREKFNEAYQAHRQNNLEKARAAYREALKLDPSYQQAHQNLALAIMSSGDVMAALPVYEIALSLNPLSMNARYGFARALDRAKYPLDSAGEYGNLLKMYPTYTPGHLELAILYSQQLQRVDLARTHYRRVLVLKPTHAQAPVIREWLQAHP